ncbi:MAG: hypothetical protein PF517_16220 [Salinivirgaceae bacterium]|jgi:hypothetical protein|nr:hypothetical protein [Salinivirgaceae bacterium]
MPYRRLPNTDISRIRAMQTALKMSEGVPPFKLSFSIARHQELKFFFPEFNQAVRYQKETLERQTEKNKTHLECLKKARLYLSHFIQVLNFAIVRGELKEETRMFFELEDYDNRLPQLNNEKDVIDWGKKLIDGEQLRLSKALAPITNPTIARVKVHYEDYLRAHKSQKHLQETHNKALQKMSDLRTKADDIIVKIWNEIEEHFSNLPAEEKRKNAEKFGVVYVYRKNEKLSFVNLKLNEVIH